MGSDLSGLKDATSTLIGAEKTIPGKIKTENKHTNKYLFIFGTVYHMKNRDTSWHKAAPWYSSLVGNTGQFFHKTVIFPTVLRWLPKDPLKVIDFGCGTGITTQFIKNMEKYVGYDNAKSLIERAKEQQKTDNVVFRFGDATRPLPGLEPHMYSCALSILSLQNMEHGEGCIQNAAHALAEGGVYIIVLNHPSFRIPRQTSWEADQKSNAVYRRVNCYLSPLSIPIKTHPGKSKSSITWSFHHPLQDYVTWLHKSGFVLSDLVELTSPKVSEGKRAHEENRNRQEFPLFLALRAVRMKGI